MSLIPSRHRLTTAALAVVVAAGVAPLLAHSALAADGSVAALPVTLVGPNAGALGRTSQGVQGTTAIFVIDVATNETISKVTVDVTSQPGGREISTNRDFETTDGFALYKDTAGGTNDTFDLVDYTAGAVSTFTPDFVNSPAGKTRMVITGNSGATGSSRYFVTVHPKKVIAANGRFTLELIPNGVDVSGPDFPASSVTTGTITLDSAPPTKPDKTHFVLTKGKELANDVYTVTNEAEAGEPTKELVYLNDPVNTAPANLLVTDRNNATSYAIYPAAQVQQSIGSGTGITKTVTTALNNQKDDRVHVRSVDAIGNLSDVLSFDLATAATLMNDVTAPDWTSYTVTVGTANAVNSTNQSAVPVTGTRVGTVADVAGQRARLVRVNETTGAHEFESPWKDQASTATPHVTHVNASSATDFPELSRIKAQAALYDNDMNVSDVVSAALVTKDTQRPTIVKIGLIFDANSNNQFDLNDVAKIIFSEPMNQTTILDTNGELTACDEFGATPDEKGAANCVNKMLVARHTNGNRAMFGKNPGFDWAADGASALITIGETTQPVTDVCGDDTPNCWTVVTNGDTVTPATSVTDANANTLSNTGLIQQLGLLPGLVKTNDGNAPSDASRFGMGRDGVVDEIKITFNGALLGSSVQTALPNFRIINAGDSIVPTHVNQTATNEIQLWFDAPDGKEHLWMTGARPQVQLLPDSSNCAIGSACTGLRSNAPGNADVDPFVVGSTDGAAPAVVSVTTSDENHNGKIDRLTVRYSEPIDHSKENRCGYLTVDAAYVPDQAVPAPAECKVNTPTPATGFSDTTILALKEKATFDTDAIPAVTFNAKASVPVTEMNRKLGAIDAYDNELTHSTGTFTWATNGTDLTFDGAQPIVTARTTRDRDADGKLDAIDVQFSETIATSSIGNGQFQVTEPTHAVLGLTSIDAKTIGVFIDETAAPGTGDTDSKPKIRYITGLTDAPLAGSKNPAFPDQAAVAAVDGAGPAIVGASFNFSGNPDDPGAPTPADDGKKMKLVFSEPVTDPVDKTKLEASQAGHTPAETEKPSDVTATTPADTKARILTFTNVFDLFKSGTIRITEANGVKDTASPQNGNTQVSAVPFLAYPTATLSLAGPAGSNPGYSTSYTFAVNANGNDAVTQWLLVVQDAANPAPTTPVAADPRWTTTQPSSHTLNPAVDGTYKGYLWTKDAVGNVSHKSAAGAVAEAQIKVIGTPPIIENAAFSNFTTLDSYVRDGDSIRVTANAKGSDAAEWASGGVCKVDNMWVDYSTITSDASKKKVAPVACDLKGVAPNQHRAMEFPFTTAAGTTHYPVGTVLRTKNVNDPGYVLEDSATGVVKRRFVSVFARRSWGVRDGEVLVVSQALLNSIPSGPTQYHRQGMVIKRQGTTRLFLVDRGRKRPVDGAYSHHWGYRSTYVTTVSSTEFNLIPYGPRIYGTYHPLGTYLRNPNNNAVYVVVAAPSGQAYLRRITTGSALMTWIPWNQVVPAVAKDLTLPVDTWQRGYRDGVMLRDGSGKYYIVSRGRARQFGSSVVFNKMGYNGSNAYAYHSGSLGRFGSDAPQPGVAINVHDVAVTIWVKNTAGAQVSKAVVPIFGLGTSETNPWTSLPNTQPRPN